MTIGEATLNITPEPMCVPPQEPVNHSTVVPEPPTAVSSTFPASSEQTVEGLAVAEVGASGSGRTVTITLAQADEPQDTVDHRA